MHSSCAARCDDNRLCPCHRVIPCLHIEKNGACRLSLLILDNLYCRSKLYHRNLAVQYFVPKGTHNFRSGIILTCMHSLSGCTAAMGRYHTSVPILIKHDAKLVQPFDCVRRFHDKTFYQFRPCSKMSAPKAVQIMLYRGIIFLICCLDTAFCHHGIGVSNPKFCYDHHIGACIVGFDGTGRAGAAAADDKHVYIIINFRNINIFVQNTAGRVEHFCKL